MDTLILVAMFVGGLACLVVGAELLVRGAAALAASFGIPALVIGLTVVAYGTSAPELAVSVQSSLINQGDIAVGNVIGSNIFNVLFVLGLAAMLAPLIVDSTLVRRDVPVMIGTSLLFWAMAADGVIARWEGLVLLAGAVGYTLWMVIAGRREAASTGGAAAGEADDADVIPEQPRWLSLVQVVGGLAVLVLGANLLVNAAVTVATLLDVPPLIIGLTVVAVGTSLPEVATSVVATLRGQRDIAVGNVVGSNIFNLLLILGVAGSLDGNGLLIAADALRFNIPVMVLVAVACLPIFFTGGIVARWEGVLLFAYYVAYMLYLISAALRHSAVPLLYNGLLIAGVLTALVLLATSGRELWQQRSNTT